MTRIYLLTAFLALAVSGLFAQKQQQQSFEAYITAADQAAQRDNHYLAYRFYSLAAEDGWSDDPAYDARIGEAYYKAGTAAYRATAYKEAEKYLVKLQSLPAVDKYTLSQYYIGQAVFRQGRYDQSVAHFQQFLNDQPRAPEAYRSIALAQINDADWAIDALTRAEDIQLNHLPEGINTQDSDIMYVRGKGSARYFSSNAFEFKNDSLKPKRTLSRIMKQTGEATAEPLPENINLPGKNVAHTAFNKEMTKVYYSVCDFRNYDELICDIYLADVATDGSWTNPRKTSVNLAGFNTAQPNVGSDEEGNEYMYFASDRPGGQGGLDLYRAPLATDGTPGVAVNLIGLNTAGDDASPFFYAPRETLYFATNGRFTFGGMDVYKSYLINKRFRRPTNMGAPVNSAADEAYYTRFDDPDQAYVGSRRPSGEALFYSDARDVCCYDLYEFTPDNRIDLQATILNKLTHGALAGATVQLFNITPNGSELVEEITNFNDNSFNFKVEPGMKYQLTVEKDGFTMVLDEFDLSSPELVDLPFIERVLELNPKVNIDVFTFNSADEAELLGVTVKLFEVADDGTLSLVEAVTNINTNDYHYELEIGNNYKIEATRPGFGEAEIDVNLRDYDADNGGITIRRDLYLGQSLEVYVIDGRTDEPLPNATLKLVRASGKLVDESTNPDGNGFYYTINLNEPFVLETKRAGYFSRIDTLRFSKQDLVDGNGKLVYYVPLFGNDPTLFLPFEVYFDNDHPDPDSYSSRTELSYKQTYVPYTDRREAFKKESSEGMDEEQAFLTKGDIDQFFNQEVEAGWKQLRRFSEALVLYLNSGGTFNIELQGYASPRASTEYNRRLSSRRNMSLKYFFLGYKEGAMAKYIEGKQLTFTEAALGETTANLDKIYERIDREREPIYSTIASLERRVVLRKGVSSKKK
jgi:tetratricopeptide (TPR) repeat protein